MSADALLSRLDGVRRTSGRTPMHDAADRFRAALRAAGLNPPDRIEADGKLRRFASSGKRGDDAGWYVLHGDGIPAGAFGCWRSGISESWRADIGRSLTPAEEAAHRAKLEAYLAASLTPFESTSQYPARP